MIALESSKSSAVMWDSMVNLENISAGENIPECKGFVDAEDEKGPERRDVRYFKSSAVLKTK